MNPFPQHPTAKLLPCIAVALLCCTLEACKTQSAPAPQASSRPAEPPAAPLDPTTLGSITGTIHLTGKPPAPIKIDTSMDPACEMSGAPAFYSEQYVIEDGKLANVYLYIKSGPPAVAEQPSSTIPVVLDQKGCRYTPHVIAVGQGGVVEFRNSDVTMHNIHTMPTLVGNDAIDISQGPKGAPILKRFPKAETMLPVRCNNHPWMNAFINVSPTPFFAVSDAKGRFEIHGLPAGQYVLGAVHEKLGEKTLSLTVTAKGSATGDFTFAIK